MGSSVNNDLNIYNRTIKQINELYESVNYGCGKFGNIYDFKTNKVNNSLCKQFSCARCRKILKKNLFFKIIEVVKEYNITNHFIMTSKGQDYRENNTIYQSYIDMAKNWNRIRRLINYWYYEKWKLKYEMNYIVMPRSQKDGYCHYHLLTDLNISQDWLETIKDKYKEMGYVKLGKNKNPAYYLTFDYWKDNEYHIPKGIRHFSTSRNIKLKINRVKTEKIYYKYNRYLTKYQNLINFDKKINEKYNYSLPFIEWLKYWYNENK